MALQFLCLSALVLGFVSGEKWCHRQMYEVPGNITFPVILSIRQNVGPMKCGNISVAVLQHVIALKYAFGKLNKVDSSGNKFIPGIDLGFTVYNDCGDTDIASSLAYDILASMFPRNTPQCKDKGAHSFVGGVIGTSRSSTTDKVSTILRHSDWPVITMGATSVALSNKTRYPNLLRTAASDAHQTKAIVHLMKSLNWTHFALIHTTDNYGIKGAVEIRQLARKEYMCVTLTRQVSVNRLEVKEVGEIFSSLKGYVENGSFGVVYIGQSETAEFILQTASVMQQDYFFLKSVQWIMSDGVGRKAEVVNKAKNLANGILTISPKPIEVTEFLNFAKAEIRHGNQSDIGWVREWSESHCASEISCDNIIQNEYIHATLDAVYALAVALKNTYGKYCPVGGGLCENMFIQSRILKELRTLELNYASMEPSRFPPEFLERVVKFDDNGDIYQSPESQIYQVNMFWDGSFQPVGFYSESQMNLNIEEKMRQKDSQGNLRISTCLRHCRECPQRQPFIYIPGEILIFVFFSIHDPSNSDPFGCGSIRTSTNTIPSLEALLYIVNEKLLKVGGNSFGVVIFDDCYNSLKSNGIVWEFLNGKKKLRDEITGDVIDPARIVAVVGPEPSGVAVPLAQSLTKLKLPQVSYSASSPELDDRSLFPYFLRTVPSDEVQANVMVNVIKAMGWKSINILFTNNNYGSNGMKKIYQFANESRICVAEPISINETPTNAELARIISTLRTNLAKVVVFIGTASNARSLLEALKASKTRSFTFVASEDWGVNMRPIKGLELEAVGSLTVTIDTSKSEKNDLYKHMIRKTPNKADMNPWFANFWEDEFKCNIPWISRNNYALECDHFQPLKEETVEAMIKDQRIIHTMNSIAAVVYGLASFAGKQAAAGQSEFPHEKFRKHPDIVVQSIRNAALCDGKVQFRPFRDDGNGNVGFLIHNLQRMPNGEYAYIQVGEYDEKTGFHIDRNKIQLYDDDETRTPVDKLDAPCRGARCSACTSANPVISPPLDLSDVKHMTIVILVVIVCVLVTTLLAIQIIRCVRVHRTKKQNDDRGTGLGVENPTMSETGSSTANVKSELSPRSLANLRAVNRQGWDRDQIIDWLPGPGSNQESSIRNSHRHSVYV